MLDLPTSRPGGARALYEPLWEAGVRILQLRMKHQSAQQQLALLDELHARRPADCLLVVNDRLDLALVGDVDGVHLGQDDLPLAAALRVLSQQRKTHCLVGISTHTPAQVLAAVAGGADYLGFGPVFPTRSKQNPDEVVGLTGLAHAVKLSPLPVVAIGGISLANVSAVAQTGAHAAAVISALSEAPDVCEAARAVIAAFRPSAR